MHGIFAFMFDHFDLLHHCSNSTFKVHTLIYRLYTGIYATLSAGCRAYSATLLHLPCSLNRHDLFVPRARTSVDGTRALIAFMALQLRTPSVDMLLLNINW